MGVTVTWTVTCDLCKRQVITKRASDMWQDETCYPPPGWDAYFYVPEEHRSEPTDDICIACPACQEHPLWVNYQADCQADS